MTQPDPAIERLRAELDVCKHMTLQLGVMPLIDAAQAVVAEYDQQIAYVKAMQEWTPPSADEIRAQLGLSTPPPMKVIT